MNYKPPASLHLRLPTGPKRERRRVPGQDYAPRPETLERRRRIRRTAAALFVEGGVLAVNMSQVARQSRTNPTTISHYYGAREELLADIVHEHAYALSLAIATAYDATADAEPRVRLEAMLRGFIDAALADRHAHILSLHGLCALSERARADVWLRWHILIETLTDPLVALVPGLAEGKEPAMALALAGLASVANGLLWFDEAETMDRDEHARRVAAMLVAGAMGEPGGTCARPTMACARAWLAVGDGPSLAGAGSVVRSEALDAIGDRSESRHSPFSLNERSDSCS
jgi:TetR/AcrR family transcriptional regulator, cholesterol catabolism regulator